MTDEEIIKLAKEKYPIGTRVNSLGGSMNEPVPHHDFYWQDTLLRVNYNCCIYDERTQRWAPIVQPEVINNYSIY